MRTWCTRLLLLALIPLLAAGCIRQRGDAGQSESRIRENTISSPKRPPHQYRDNKEYMAYWP